MLRGATRVSAGGETGRERKDVVAHEKRTRTDGDDHLGAVEGDRPTDTPSHGNSNAPALDDEGLPNDPIAICEDVIGANVDGSEGG
jgi:hypothetical protein